MNLQGKTILITGASGGIGREIAVRLARQHARLILVGRDPVALQETQTDVSAAGGSADVLVADLLSQEDRERIVGFCTGLEPGLWGLINNAGCNHFALLQDQSDAMLQNQINLNLLAPMLLIRALLPLLQKEQGARILNMGSTFGSIGYPGYSAYCASKFGLRGFTEALRRELSDSDIRVLYFAPRATATKLNSENVIALNKELGNAMDLPDIVAAQVEKMFVSGGPHQVFWGWPEKLFARINQCIPMLVDNALQKQLPAIKKYATLSKGA
ncbi:MAG: SDR family oxidoreductase [Cellvibrionales bacterium]|nr:SDR family oxidoreductase [Cellvibrionales bacterium]